MIGNLFKFIVIGILAIVGIGLAMLLIGLAVGLAVLAVKVAVIALIGMGIYKLVGGGKKKVPEISEADKKWLES